MTTRDKSYVELPKCRAAYSEDRTKKKGKFRNITIMVEAEAYAVFLFSK